MNTNFKTTMFGGFNKEDVIKYIENNAKENNEKISELETLIERLRQENEEFKEHIYVLEDDADKLKETSLTLEAVTIKNSELEKENAELKRIIEELKGPAEEYKGLKEHIADIEISAHKRTEEFRQKAILELKAFIQKEREWCAATKETIQQKNKDILERIKTAEDTINETDYSVVDEVLDSLEEFENNLK